MLTNDEFVTMIKDQTMINQKMLDVLEAIKENTKETSTKLSDVDKTLMTVVTKYKHFSDLMRINIALMGAMLFALVGMAIKI